MPHDPVQDLRAEIARGRVLAIVGAGVSIAATNRAPCADWIGLLKDGVQRCVAFAQPLPANWEKRVLEQIGSGDLDEMLLAAENISRRLGAPKGGEYRDWLRDSVGALKVADRSVLEALQDLRIPLATTNYDGLLEEVTGLDPVTWREGAAVERVVRGDGRAILHFHGYWEDPKSVILGIRSYEEVLGDARAQNVLRTLRTVHTLLFVGCGEGLADPNFGALLYWTRMVFAESEYRHYRLCRDSEQKGLQKKHPRKERIHVLPYGPDFSDLAAFLRSLRPAVTGEGRRAEEKSSSTLAEKRPPRLDRLGYCFGREKEIEDLVATLLMDSPLPVPVLGGPGIGKSTVTLAALHDPRVAKRFGGRRYFVHCDGAKSREALIGEIATTVRIEPGPNLEDWLFQDLENAAAVLALDNAETPWEADTAAVEDLLSQLGGIPGLALIASVRGEQRPFGPNWREAIRVGPLDLDPAQLAFLKLAGERHRNDPHLDRLLETVDRLPLAVALLALQAETEPDLSNIWKRWQEKRVALLRRTDGKERLNLDTCLELSIQSRRMTDPARRLLSLLGVVPDGIAREDVPALLSEEGETAASTLRCVGLVRADDPRLRLLAPVRDYVQERYPPTPKDLRRVTVHFLRLAELGEKAGREGGAEAIQRLTPETGNLETIVLQELNSADPEPAILASLALGKFYDATGLGTVGLLERARAAAQRLGDGLREAGCLEKIADIALNQSDHDTARKRYEEALPIYERVGSLLGQANCIKGFGDIALRKSDHDTARERYEEAISIFRDAGDLLGRASCIKGLGDIALRRSNHGIARERYEEAIPLFRSAGSLLGQANCLKGLGDIALRRSDHDAARERYEEASTIFQRIGALLGQANCIQGLGDIALEQSDHDPARERYEEAIPLFRQLGSLLGQANCIKGLGDIALEQSNFGTARERYGEALPLYKRVGNLLGQANCIQALGDIALEQSDYDAARERYEEAIRIYKRVGNLIGQANCVQSLGDIALDRSDHDAARKRYKKAIAMYKRVGNLLGLANCIQRLGDVAWQRYERDAAWQYFKESLPLYEQLQEPYSIGWAYSRLAQVALTPQERREHIEAARATWTRINRLDLVKELDEELGETEEDAPPAASPAPEGGDI